MIIDVHAHLGYDVVFDEEQDEELLLQSYRKYGIDRAIVQPFICRPYMEDTKALHDRIAKFCGDNPGRFWGMASIQPHFAPADYEEEALRCVRELRFVGLKISTIAHATNPSSKDGFHVFEVARSLNVPVMIHTGIGIPFADPAAAWKVVEAFPDVKTVLAHAGSNLMVTQAALLARTFDNVYLEPSWLPGPYLESLLKTLGADKIMFSTDACANIPIELKKYRTAIKKDSDFKRVTAGTAMEVYRLQTVGCEP